MQTQTVSLEIELHHSIDPQELIEQLAYLLEQHPESKHTFKQIWIESNVHLKVVDFKK